MPVVSREEAESAIRYYLTEYYDRLPEDNPARRLRNALLAFRLDYDVPSLTVDFPIEPWMTNTARTLHGGMTAMCADIVCGTLARVMYGVYPPTVMLSISYLRAALCGDVIRVRAHATHLGRNNVNILAEITSRDSGELLATVSDINFVGGAAFEGILPQEGA